MARHVPSQAGNETSEDFETLFGSFPCINSLKASGGMVFARVSSRAVGRGRVTVTIKVGVGGRAHQARTGWHLVRTTGVWGHTHTYTGLVDEEVRVEVHDDDLTKHSPYWHQDRTAASTEARFARL